jgi:uncharacterized protein (DUF952 family)
MMDRRQSMKSRQGRGEWVSDFILHATTRIAWYAAEKRGQYVAESLELEGFIHCSKADQIMRVADSYFAGQHGLVLLVIDPVCLGSELRWEPGADLATELFPHIHGPVNLEAVVTVVDFEPGADGKFKLPDSLVIHG